MKRQAVIISVLAITLVGALLATSLAVSRPRALAQGDSTPTPDETGDVSLELYKDFYNSPEAITGDAEWTLEAPVFVSHYPKGFEFSVQAVSSAGEIEAATAYWSHVPGQQRRISAVLDEESGRYVANWEVDSTVPPWIAVNYHWRFTDSAGNTYTSTWVMGEEYADNTRTWERIEGEDLIIFLQEGLPARVATESIEAMNTQRETYREAWGGLLSYKPRAVMFNDRVAFNEWRVGFVERTDVIVIGQTSGDWGATVQVVSDGDYNDLAYGTVLHEVAHLYQSEFTRRAGLAGVRGWWTEGQATFFELNQQYDYEERVRQIARDGLLEPLLFGEGPNPGGNGPDNFVRYGYDVGYSFFRWLDDTYGLVAHRQIMDAIRGGMSRDEALESVLGISVSEIENAWRQWLGAKGDVPTLIPTPTTQFRLPPTQAPFQSPTP